MSSQNIHKCEYMSTSKLTIDEKALISRIRQLREDYAGERGKALFSKALGIRSSTYNYYERDRVPPVELLWAICQLTGADIRWLITGDRDHEGTVAGRPVPRPLIDRIGKLLEKDSSSLSAIIAFIELLEKRATLEKVAFKEVKPSDATSSKLSQAKKRSLAEKDSEHRNRDRASSGSRIKSGRIENSAESFC